MTDRQPIFFEEIEKSVNLIVKTRSPEKWLLIDRETGEIYVGNLNGYWDKLKKVERVDK